MDAKPQRKAKSLRANHPDKIQFRSHERRKPRHRKNLRSLRKLLCIVLQMNADLQKVARERKKLTFHPRSRAGLANANCANPGIER